MSDEKSPKREKRRKGDDDEERPSQFKGSQWRCSLSDKNENTDHYDKQGEANTCRGMLHLRNKFHSIDLKLVIGMGMEEVIVHKIILAALSPYLESIFPKELPQGRVQEVVLSDFKTDTIKTLIEYAYTGVLKINNRNIQDVLETANFLEIESVVNIASDFLLKQMNVENCVGFFAAANTQKCVTIRKRAKTYILQNFERVRFADEFNKIPVDLLYEIVSHPRLVVILDKIVPDEHFQEHVILESVLKHIVYFHPDTEKEQMLTMFIPALKLWAIHPDDRNELLKQYDCYEEANKIWAQLSPPKLNRIPGEIQFQTNGPFGRGDGQYFEDHTYMTTKHYIKGIDAWIRKINDQDGIGGIQFHYNDNYMYFHGDKVGNPDPISLAIKENERFIKVTVWHDDFLYGLKLETHEDAIMVGSEHGTKEEVTPPPGTYGYLAHIMGHEVYHQGSCAFVNFHLVWGYYDIPEVIEEDDHDSTLSVSSEDRLHDVEESSQEKDYSQKTTSSSSRSK